jgi:hypothetical protein
MACAPSPPTSSSWPSPIWMVRAGVKPSSSSVSIPVIAMTRKPFMSSAPRPHTKPSATAPEKGGWVHWSSVPDSTGTTS